MLRRKPISPITYSLCPLPAWLERCAAEEVKVPCGVTGGSLVGFIDIKDRHM